MPGHVTKGLDNLDLVGAQREPGPQWPQWLSARCFHRNMLNQSAKKRVRDFKESTCFSESFYGKLSTCNYVYT